MRNLFTRLSLVAMVFFLASSGIAWACPKERKATLREYRLQEYGHRHDAESLILKVPKDSEHCEKIRYDMRFYACIWSRGYKVVNGGKRWKKIIMTASGAPFVVAQAMRRKPHRIGGKAAYERGIDRAWRDYYNIVADIADMAPAKRGYYKAEDEFRKNKCKGKPIGLRQLVRK